MGAEEVEAERRKIRAQTDAAARHAYSARMEIYGRGVPRMDRHVNPKGLKTAAEYHRWLSTTPSTPGDAGGFLGELEYEEHVTGNVSYPPDHPRFAPVMHGRYYPDGEPKPQSLVRWEAERSRSGVPPEAQDIRQAAEQRLGEAPRANRFGAICAVCGGSVAPGEGRMQRTIDGYVTVHHHH